MGSRPERVVKPIGGYPSIQAHLFAEPYEFDFFQAVRLLERLFPKSRAVGKAAKPDQEVVRFRSWVSLSFPPSSVMGLLPADGSRPPLMTESFLGMAGASGVLPRHYTEMLLRIDRDVRGPERTALRDWLDLFTHRFTSLFFRAWEKYRFPVAFERGEFRQRDPDTFTRALLSLVGLGTSGLNDRMRVAARIADDAFVPTEKSLARVDDLTVLWFGGHFARRPRNAASLEAILAAFVRLSVKVHQFQGQWLRLETDNQSRLGLGTGNNCLGRNVIVGDRIWDVQSKIRVQMGPMAYRQFVEFLPDRSARAERKGLFLLAQLVRLYVGPEMDVEFQLVLEATEVPVCRVGRGSGIGTRLGWNAWSHRRAMPHDASDAVFQADDALFVTVASAER